MTLLARTLLAAMTIASTLSASTLAAETAAPPPTATAPCESAQNRQFDFWLGQWDVTNPAGQLAGHSRIESILGGCVLLENWDSPSGVSGKSFTSSMRRPGSGNSSGSTTAARACTSVAGWQRATWCCRACRTNRDAQSGLKQRERITWTPNADGSVRQLWETSIDDGKTWKTSFDGLYRHPAR